MGRLEKYEKKQLTTNIIFAIIFLLVLIYFIFTIGIKILLSSSVFIAQLTAKKTPIPTIKNNQTTGSINIDLIPTATNSSIFIVTGSVINFNDLAFYLNEEKVKEIELVSSDTFTEEIKELKEGGNQFYILAKIKNESASKKTPLYNILYKPSKPQLDIQEPGEQTKTNKLEIVIKGKTEKETFIRINDLPIVVDASGNFQTAIRLKEGENKIIVIASDIAGNIETRELTVFYQKE